MKKIILITFLLANLSFAFGQNLSVETTPKGDGPVFSTVTFASIKAYTQRAISSGALGTTPARAVISFNLKGMDTPTAYKYKGKSYTLPFYGDEGCYTHAQHSAFSAVQVRSQVTVSVNIEGKTYSETKTITQNHAYFEFTLEGNVSANKNIEKNVSVKVKPLPISALEFQLEKYHECKKRKENEKKAKEIADKEAKGQKTNKKDDDFWAGGEETKLKIVMPDAQKAESTASKQPDTKNADINIKGTGKAIYDEELAKTFTLLEYANYRVENKRWVNDGWWWIRDKDNNVIIPKNNYKFVSYEEGLAVVYDESQKQYKILDSKGNISVINNIDYSINYSLNFKEGLLMVELGEYSNGKIGFVNKYAEWVIPPKYKKAFSFSEGLARVSEDGEHWGFIDKQGKVVIPFQYRWDEISDFSDGLALVKTWKVSDKKYVYKFIDKTGKNVLYIDNKWEAVFPFTDGLAFVKTGRGYKTKTGGYIDVKGNLVHSGLSEHRFGSSGYVFSEGFVITENEIIDKNLNTVNTGHYYNAQPFKNGFAWISDTWNTMFKVSETKYVDYNGVTYIHDKVNNTFKRKN